MKLSPQALSPKVVKIGARTLLGKDQILLRGEIRNKKAPFSSNSEVLVSISDEDFFTLEWPDGQTTKISATDKEDTVYVQWFASNGAQYGGKFTHLDNLRLYHSEVSDNDRARAEKQIKEFFWNLK